MLAIVLKDDSDDQMEQGLSLYVGEHNPYYAMEKSVKEIYLVQADGHELEKIKDQITGIPHSTNAVQRWYGDDAKFIAANLNLQK